MGSGLSTGFGGDFEEQKQHVDMRYQTFMQRGLVEDEKSKALLELYHEYLNAYEKLKQLGNDVDANPCDMLEQQEVVTNLLNDLEARNEEYFINAEIAQINVGDVVEVKAFDSFLYFQGIVLDVNENGTYVIEYTTEIESDRTESNVDPKRVRKVHSWEFLEKGDTVLVKDGQLRFQGTIVETNIDGTVDVDLGNPYGGNNEEDEPMLDQIETFAREDVRKIYTTRLPKANWQKACVKVRYSLMVTKAFKVSTLSMAG